jgi:hypothetical protein
MPRINERSRLPLATLVGAVALSAASFSTPATAANGTHPSSQGGTICKGGGVCLMLEIECTGTYTDATDPDGTVYGHCPSAAVPKSDATIKSN